MSIGIDLVRSWYGLDTELVRAWLYPDKDETKKMSCTSLLAIWHYGNMAISQTRERYTYNTEYKSHILLQFKTQKHTFYFNSKHGSNEQIFCKSQKSSLLYQFEIKLILLPNILIATIGITTE